MVGRSFALLVGALLTVTGLLESQSPPDPVVDSARIKAIVVEASDVFPSTENRGLLPKLFNGLHFTTRSGIIRRELLLHPGDVFDSAKVAESERNLRALRVFRMVRIDSVRSDSGLILTVATRDAFSIVADLSVDGSDQGLNWRVGLSELNLLGTATRVAARYRHTQDRNAVNTTFQRDRLIDGRIGLGAIFDQRTDGHQVYGVLSLPYLSFSSSGSWYASGEERDERVLRFRDGIGDVASATLQRRFWMGRVGAGWALRAAPSGYVHVGLDGQLRRDDYSDRARVDTIGHTVTGALTGYLQWRAAKFLVKEGIQGFGRDEDVDLSTVVQVGLGLTPKAFGYSDNGVVPSLSGRIGVGWSGGFATLSGSALGRLTGAGAVDSGSVHLSALFVLKPNPRHVAVLHGSRGWQKNPTPGAEFDYGLGLGPRGFRAHSFTGDRSFLVTGEYRYLLTDRFLRSAALGLAGFADYGGAWFAGSARRTGYSVGVGIRFGFTVTTDLSPARLDLAYVNGSGLTKGAWRLVLGKGFVFSSTGRLDR